MIVLGLDAATKTGFCFYDSDKKQILESGVQDFAKKRGESNGLMFMRYRKWLDELIGDGVKLFGLALVGYEAAHHRGGAATEICVNLTGRIQEACANYEIEFATVRTMTLKKFATGKGNADKTEMMVASVKHLGRAPIDDNEADAVWVAIWTANEYCVNDRR